MSRFTPSAREWFLGAFASPTPVQTEAWESIAQGAHSLVVAPTGSGKTLAAFLWALDGLIAGRQLPGATPAEPTHDPTPSVPAAATVRAAPAAKTGGTSVLYISPLKALGIDVERNLRAPLVGITQTAKRLGLDAPNVSVGVRSGDTPANERRRLLSHPPDILITTPESLFLMLTSKARATLTDVHTIIIDEVHAVAGTKRGAHLAVSLERLDALLERPAQRIGLSATVEPRETVAGFLGGCAPVRIVAPASHKNWNLSVTVPVADMTQLPELAVANQQEPSSGLAANASIWPHVEEKIVDAVLANNSTIVFANSRRLAERLTARLNEIYVQRLEVAELRHDGAAAANSEPWHAPRNAQSPARLPAQIMAQAGAVAGAPDVLAKAHHGSVSKEQRALIEDDLKSGRLRCVVATSSLELGIDMGAVDLVIQVESPPSVASGLQRVGRAGHQVGEVSQGLLFPKHRADLLHSAVTVERMLAGHIEPLKVPLNPLDILAQQTVAATALETLDVDTWFNTIRRSAPFLALPRSAYDATLDLLAGRYPSDEFAELRPRIIWDRTAGTITGRPGAQRLAVTSGGTIPDRGLFGVFIVPSGSQAPQARSGSLAGGSPADDDAGSTSKAANAANASKGGRRVGELDEEMVYESRVGDVFALGATSWKIENITFDRVLVSPAFGQPGKLPFWKGDSLGRPVELGRALGAFIRELSAAPRKDALARCLATGLDDWAASNLLGYLDEQKAATTVVPDDRTLMVERFHDELGDWRVVLHSPFGMPVHAPWALAVAARLHEKYGMDGSAMASDDGIVLRVPMMDDEPPGADLFLFESEELDGIVTAEVGGSALFASRFRECAARALLLPRQNPGKRSPLWQQRQRSAQLLDVARKYPKFPIVLETVRECLQDVYDLPALKSIATAIERRELRIVETTTAQPSPFARSLLFGYVASFLYEGDSPLAERRAAALSLDPALLDELLGRAELRELLDPQVIASTEAQLQRLAPDRRARGLEGVADLLRLLGPLSVEEVTARLNPDDTDATPAASHLRELVTANRALRVNMVGEERFAAIEDAARLRDALGIPLPMGVPLAFIEPVEDPLGDLISRYARTHGPFTAAQVAVHLGLGVAVVQSGLARLAADKRVSEGEFLPEKSDSGASEWCDVEVLRRLRRRSLAALRAEVEPVDAATFARFLPAFQHVGAAASAPALRGLDGLLTVVDQLAGVPIPASAWEPLVLAQRVADYRPAMLDELMATGEVMVSGSGALGGSDGWLSLHMAESAELTLNAPTDFAPTDLAQRTLSGLSGGGAYFLHQLREMVMQGPAEVPSDAELTAALWELFWAGQITNDTFLPVRALLSGGHTAHKQKPAPSRLRPARSGRYARLSGRASGMQRSAPPQGAGRWSALPAAFGPESTEPSTHTTVRSHALAELFLDRYGVITRGSVMNQGVPGGFALMYKVLARLEESGKCRRGYFIEHLGAAQFAVSATVDRLRTFSEDATLNPRPPQALALAATDPANPYGAALGWPPLDSGHRPGRKVGALVVMVDGALVLYVERGGKTLLCFSEDEAAISLAAQALVKIVQRGAVDKLAIAKVNGAGILDTPLSAALLAAGAYSTPQGVRIRA
ncbi:DNA glycosylase AlkZ-like family protein [Arthrobacter cryoconiti]|uniref:DNA glycosylase AlkZ-like family protein n=1 Tax=Arthrobacter cryoconiti TaxID=748907 RepID=A0ABV8QZF1_9MICC|nr:crosslink repair DNA glycosylase YcaQ family protein [Arthrobacter cryoconiti]MCC9067690.1 DEAD/DEAH box helicase [Arthrobacter cryoconiti]